MEAMDYWRLCDELTVVQAALLTIGLDPATLQDDVERWQASERPAGFDAVFAGLKNAINGKSLAATVRHEGRWLGSLEYPNTGEELHAEVDGDVAFKSCPDWKVTTVKVEDLKNWMRKRWFLPTFFFPDAQTDAPSYLDTSNSAYAPKLAAAVRAWEAVNANKSLLEGKTPKQAMEKWLREHASEYGLTKDDGSPNETGIEEICKIANWKPEGGAAKTPNQTPANNNPPSPKQPLKTKKIQAASSKQATAKGDPDIPF